MEFIQIDELMWIGMNEQKKMKNIKKNARRNNKNDNQINWIKYY